jgi:hypothetical protein
MDSIGSGWNRLGGGGDVAMLEILGEKCRFESSHSTTHPLAQHFVGTHGWPRAGADASIGAPQGADAGESRLKCGGKQKWFEARYRVYTERRGGERDGRKV